MMHSSLQFFSSFQYNLGGQLSSRLISFALNIYLLRMVNKVVLGVANVRLTLLYSTALFLSREPFRKACLGLSDSLFRSRTELTQFVNILWISTGLCSLVGLVLCPVWIFVLNRPSDSVTRHYTSAVICFWLSALIEVIAEPFWTLCQHCQCVGYLAFVQSLHVFLQRLLVTALIFSGIFSDLVAFSLSQLFSSFVYLVLLFVGTSRLVGRKNTLLAYCSSNRDLFPHFSFGVNRRHLLLVCSFFGHSLLKQLLTDGAAYVMTFFHVLSFADQAIYDAIDRLGSLVARILLAPLEESAHVYFSQNVQRQNNTNEQDQDRLSTVTGVLFGLMRITVILGLIFCVFGVAYSRLALSIYGGQFLASGSGPTMLRIYCFYMPFLALNGITECFALATMANDEVYKHGLFMALVGVMHLALHLFLSSSFGGSGFILANCINMAIRIIYSLHYIHCFYRSQSLARPLSVIIPTLSTLLILLASFLFTNLSSLLFCCDGFFNTIAHLSVGLVFFIFTLIVIYSSDFTIVAFMERFVVQHRKSD